MVTYIWVVFIVCGSAFYVFSGNIAGLNEQILRGGIDGVNLLIDMMPLLIIWCGIMRIAEDAKLLDKFALVLHPLLRKLFPSLKINDPALGYISSNIAANMLGLGSAATPFGLKAMSALQKNNKNKECATDAMVTFLILNTGGVTILPTTVLALRMSYGSVRPTSIIIPSIIATFCSNIVGLVYDYYKRKKNNNE